MSKTLIESDSFPFEFVSRLAEKESWRKEIHRPMYHLHKWWAKRLGSVFRAILLSCVLPENVKFDKEYYSPHNFADKVVLDPFMGSGTTIGEALKLGFTTYGNDINPVAAETVRVSLSPFDVDEVNLEFEKLSNSIGEYLGSFYKTIDSGGTVADVLYFFWVMQGTCSCCGQVSDLFSNYIVAASNKIQ